MKLTTKTRYGTLALIEIARNQARSKTTKRKDISQVQPIPESYLESILSELRNSGLVDTTRGPKGGFVLSRQPSQITMFEILTALQGDLSLTDCTNSVNGKCCNNYPCNARWFWLKLEKNIEKTLRSTTLQELVDKNESSDQYVI
ncbi:AsnC family transcriptional regulator [Fibrobacterales bacterium]|nr:AsnC family transcriptional regulator [Fibrobacterales bacterium]